MTKNQIDQLTRDLSHVAEVSVQYRTKIKPSDRPKVTGIFDGERILRGFYDEFGMMEQKEIFSVLLLDRANKVLGFLKVCEGSSTDCVVDVPYIFRAAILAGAAGLILCHNHPSGNMKPSPADIQITAKIKTGANLMDLEVLDHLILGPEENQFYSFAGNDLL